MPTLSVHNSDYEPVDQLGNEPGVNLDELKRSRASLGDDLCSALDADFDWMGKHYFARSYARAESELDSVSMKIEGKDGGGFDLWTPLEPWHVEEFIENASQAPFGHGGEKLVDTSVRDTWEIEGSRVKLKEDLQQWIKEIVLRDVWKGLGVAPFETEPRLDLYKLLLYKEGGHFRAHQDTEKAEGMFATVIVLLPHQYSGGEVHITHNMSTEVIDFSAQSKRNISILAWYTDVLHEVKPVTSGHRVALSFNLIHTTPSIPRPQFKSASPIPLDEWLAKLRSVLERWVKHGCPIKKVSRRLPPSQYTIRKQYLTKLTPQFYAYVLKHRYSLRDLNKGRACLKGEDAHKFSLLSLLAKELGFKLALARLEIGISGVADDLERYEEMVESKRWERRWAWEEKMKKEMKERKKRGEKVEKIDPDDFDSADEEDERNWKSEPFNLINTYETKYNLRKVVKDSGKPFIKKSSSEVKIPLDGENFNIIPKDPVYLGEDPDQRQYRPSGYLGNDPGDLTFWYNNAVVIIYHERDEEKLVPYFKGDDWDHDLEYPH